MFNPGRRAMDRMPITDRLTSAYFRLRSTIRRDPNLSTDLTIFFGLLGVLIVVWTR